MRAVNFYHRETGILHGNQLIISDLSILAANTPADHVAIEGHHDHLSKRVDLSTGLIVEWIPPLPSADHVWNPENKRWQLCAAAADKVNHANAARRRIAQLEASQPKYLREHALGKPGAAAELQKIDDEITALQEKS